MSNYFNEYGLMRMHLNYEVENGLLFRFRYESYYAYWSDQNLAYESKVSAHWAIINSMEPVGEEVPPNYKKFSANPPESTQHFSRDNMYGLYGLCYMYTPIFLKELPLMWWNNRKGTDKITPWLHFNGFSVFMSLKSKVWAYFWFPIVFIMMLFSYCSWLKNNNRTSSLNLWWDILPLLAKQCVFHKWVFNFVREQLIGDVKEAQDYYASMGGVWQNHDNPLRRLING